MKNNKTSDAQIKASMTWNEKNKHKFKDLKISFKVKEEADLIEKVYSQENKSKYIKELIKKDLKK